MNFNAQKSKWSEFQSIRQDRKIIIVKKVLGNVMYSFLSVLVTTNSVLEFHWKLLNFLSIW